MKRNLYKFIFILFFLPSMSWAGAVITYHGRILDQLSRPLQALNVTFRIRIYSPTPAKCLLYEEKRSIDMSNSQGVFVIPIGDGKGTRSGNDPNLRMEIIFANNGVTIPNLNCNTVGAYTPQPLDQRLMEVSYDDHSGYGWDDLPPMDLSYVPLAVSAHDAQNLGGTPAQSVLRVHSGDPNAPFNATPLTPTGFTELLALVNGSSSQFEKINQLRGSTVPVLSSGQVLGWGSGGWTAVTPMTSYEENDPSVKDFAKSNLPNCGSNFFLQTNLAGGFDCVEVSGAAGGTVTSVTAGVGLNVNSGPAGSITTMGTLNVDVGTGAGKIVQIDSTGKLPAVDGSQLTGVAALTASSLTNTASISTSGNIATTGSISAQEVNATGDIVSNGRIHAGTMLSSKSLYLYDDKLSPNTGSIGLKAPADVPANYVLTLPNGQGASGQVLGMSSSAGQLAWINPSSESVTEVKAGLPLISSGGATPEISLSPASTSQSGYLTSNDWNTFNKKIDSTALFEGDVSGTYTATSVDRIKGIPVVPSGYMNGQVLRYNAGSWVNSVLNAATDFTGVLAISNGGTGASTAAAARTNLELKSAATVDTGSAAGNIPVLGFGGLIANKMCTSDGTASGVICISDIPAESQWISNGNDISFSGGNVGVGTVSPSSLFTVSGLIESTVGGIKFPDGTVQTTAASGAAGTNGLGSWQTFAFNAVHQAASDGLVVAIMHGSSQAGIDGYTDSSNPPTTRRLHSYSWASSGGSSSLTMPVKAGDYWRVTTSYSIASTSVYWIPLSAGGDSLWQASAGNLYYNSGNMGLGTANPGAKLEVVGQIKITGGSPGVGKVLTSNASGLATWETPSVVTADSLTGTLALSKGGTGATSAADARTNLGLGTAALFNTPISGNAGSTELVKGNDSRLSDARMPVDGSVTTNKIADGAVTLAKIQNSGGDLFSQYVLAAGRSGGQTIYGGSSGSTNLTLIGSNNAAPGNIIMNPNGGRVGIGTNSPTAALDVAGHISFANQKGSLSYYNVSGYDQTEIAARGPTTSLSLVTNGISRVNITPAGNMAVGSTTASHLLHVHGSAIATSWNLSSDARLKANIKNIENPLEKILQLRGVEFDWRKDIELPTKSDQTHDIGVIAQEVEEQFPEAVTTASDGYKSVAYSKLVAPLIETVKALYLRIIGLEQGVENQARQIASLDEQKANKSEVDLKISNLERLNSEKDKEILSLKSRLEKIEEILRAKEFPQTE